MLIPASAHARSASSRLVSDGSDLMPASFCLLRAKPSFYLIRRLEMAESNTLFGKYLRAADAVILLQSRLYPAALILKAQTCPSFFVGRRFRSLTFPTKPRRFGAIRANCTSSIVTSMPCTASCIGGDKFDRANILTHVESSLRSRSRREFGACSLDRYYPDFCDGLLVVGRRFIATCPPNL